MKAEVAVLDRDNLNEKLLKRAGSILRSGGLVAFPTETVYGLGADALNPGASKKIYAAKGRPSDNPLIVHIADTQALPLIAKEIPEKAWRAAEAFWPGPLTMILPKTGRVPYETTGGLDTVAIRMPRDEIALALIREGGGYVAAPSANTSGRPSPTTAAHVEEDLGEAVDMILDGGQVEIGLESTIIDFTSEVPTVLRPGYYNLEMLSKVLGEVRMDPGLEKADAAVRPKAPGMKYRHYAPKAEMVVVEGPLDETARTIRELAEKAEALGKKTGILASQENSRYYKSGDVKVAGSLSHEEAIAHNLYEILREFDDDGVDVIYSEAFHTPGIGQAVMNRLLKAAGHKVIQTADRGDLDCP